jgi:DNA-directed RNA polymerase subunit RPC12/RpoP
MAMYIFKCQNCGRKSEFRIGMFDIPEANGEEEIDLKNLNLRCKKCKNTIFKKLITAHQKSSENWSAWQRPGLNTPTKKPTGKKSPPK